MKPLLTVLNKTLVREFYRQHAGAFTVVLLLAGGFMRGQEHHALATYAVHSPLMLGAYFALWLVYTLNVVRFGVKTFRQHPFLQLIRLVPLGVRIRALLAAAGLLLLPVLGYAGYVSVVGWQQEAGRSLAVLVLGLPLLTLLPVLLWEYFLRNPDQTFRLDWPGVIRFNTPYPLFFIRLLLRNEPLTLLLTKAGSLLLLAGLCALYPTDDYDLRLLLLGALLAAALHSGLLYQFYRFEAVHLSLLRNLPTSTLRRFATYVFILMLLLLPELLLLLRSGPEGVLFSRLLAVWLLLVGLALVLYTLLLARHQPPDRLMPLVGGMVIFYFFLIMYRIPAYGLVAGTFGGGAFLFFRFFPKSEPAFFE